MWELTTMYDLIFLYYLMQVPAIQQKRTVAFLNQFVVHTVQFLNCFSTVCEEVCLLFSQLSIYTIKKNLEMRTIHLNIFDAIILVA